MGKDHHVAVVSMKQLLEAGVHFGHQTRRWNPKMKRFIFGERNGIYIIDLQQTLARIETAYTFVRDVTAKGGSVLFVGTKKQAQDPIEQYANRCGMPFVNERWLGGMLTNFQTMHKRVTKMLELERQRDSGEFAAMPKKEALLKTRELDKLARYLGGIRSMEKLPQAVFVLDTKKEHIAVTEANKLRIPVVAVVDTNCDPDVIDYVIPGNDDAIRSGTLLCRVIADAVIEGKHIASLKVPVAPRAVDDEQRVAAEQAEARRLALLESQQREARVAAGRPIPPPPPAGAPAAEAAPADPSAAEGASADAPAAEGASADAPAAEGASADAPAAEGVPADASVAEAPAAEAPSAPAEAPADAPAAAEAPAGEAPAAEEPAEAAVATAAPGAPTADTPSENQEP
jgi:small subunit ribosomal protein S2